MKIKATMELDLTGTSYNIDNLADLNVCLMNIGMFFQKLENTASEDLIESFDPNLTDAVKKALKEIAEHDIKVAKSIFNDYRLEGTTDDGHTFVFTHKEPGYEEKTIIDGKLV